MGAQKGKNPKVRQSVVIGTPFLLGYTSYVVCFRPAALPLLDKKISKHHHRPLTCIANRRRSVHNFTQEKLINKD